MNTNSRVGKIVDSRSLLAKIKDEDILIEASLRTGQPLSASIIPSSPSGVNIELKEWKQAYLAAKNADYPNMNPMYEVYDNIRVDNSLTSNIDTIILKCQQAKFNLVDANGKPDEEAKKLLETQWMLDFIKNCLESGFEGFRLIELIDFDENGLLKKITAVNKYHVKAKKQIVTVDPGDDKGDTWTDPKHALYYITIGDADDLGILYKVAPLVLAKKYAIGNWSEFNEKMGIPFRTVTTNMANAARQKQLGVIMEKMGSAGWAVLNEGEKVELLEAYSSDPTKCFEGLIHILDSERAMLLMGQSSTSNSDKNKGTYGSMQILQEISDDRHEANLTFLKHIFNNILLKRLPLLSPAYKSLANLTWEWDKSVDLSVSEIVDYVVKLSDVYDIPSDFVTQKTGIPIDGKKQSTTPIITTDPKKKSPVNSHRIDSFYGFDNPNSHSCCSTRSGINIEAVSLPSFTDEVLRIAKLFFDGKQKGYLDDVIIEKTANHLLRGILSGYKAITEDSSTEDINMLKSLSENVFVFSGFKTYELLRSISDKLIDSKGNARSWPDFKKEVLNVDSSYNVRYLKAEYDNAVVSSQQASQWVDIQSTKDTLPLLRFVATLDDRTTDICSSLNDVTLPADHEFWQTHFLPLHWHERSLIQQLASGKITDMSKIQIPALQPMFNTNVGVTGVVFPDSHPYFEVSEAAKKAINKAVKKIMPDNL